MKIKKYLVTVPIGLALSIATSFAVQPCTSDPVPCAGPQTINGYGCSTGCPPTYPDDGCCAYTQYRVNCNSGPDQFYVVRGCEMVHTCGDPIGSKNFHCTVF